MNNKKIGFALTGSFCTIGKVLPVIRKLAENNEIVPVFSYSVASTDTRFGTAAKLKEDITEITGHNPIASIVEAEVIGPKNDLDLLIIAPCTGNTMAKLNLAITDTPVLMAAKAHLRNKKPLLIALATNDGLSGSAQNLGDLMNRKFVYFVPFNQDDPEKKPNSLSADFSLLEKAADAALEGRQLQPAIAERKGQ